MRSWYLRRAGRGLAGLALSGAAALLGRSATFWWTAGVSMISFWAIFTGPRNLEADLAFRLIDATLATIFFGGVTLIVARVLRRLRMAQTPDTRRVMASRQLPLQPPLPSPAAEAAPPLDVEVKQPKLASGFGQVRLHPTVADAAQVLWQGEHRREAVEQAARAVSALVQGKLRRSDVADDQLMQQAFSDDPPKPGAPRLRFPGSQATPTWSSRMRGARMFSQGCFAGIRNVAAHEHRVDWNHDVALEYLAAFSVLARWIDECEVYRVD